MGIRDWFKKKADEPEEIVHEQVVLPELDKEELLDETLSALESEDVQLTESEIVEATPEYDSGFVEVEDLLDDEMESNYELNTVDETEFDDLLEGAEIIGDLPSEVDFESD
ncbi:MAG: hypothetical protein CMB28_01460 [Euryarchaeota archaeon]|nr:hypothetical protein [Euryarchaeota archaeon]|tara:strand:- start:3029 stop:3361 length:333 start_codon:yes stop_codon:yes gene_type:complete